MVFTVAISATYFPDAEIEKQTLADIDVEVVETNAYTTEQLVDRGSDADAILNMIPELSADVFDSLSDLKVVSQYAVGVDHVNVEAATDAGVIVTNVPDYCVDEVATHTIALLLSCVRKIPLYDRSVKAGNWSFKVGIPISRLAGATLGFAAFGRIPQDIARKLGGFDLELLAYDPYLTPDEVAEHGVEPVAFDELLARSDILSIHTPLTEETEGTFGRDEFRSMKDSAIVINCGRGGVVDEEALHDALTEDELAGAGIDVLAEEPPESNRLLELDNVIVTPHAAWYSEESATELRHRAALNVRTALEGGIPENTVNPSAVK